MIVSKSLKYDTSELLKCFVNRVFYCNIIGETIVACDRSGGEINSERGRIEKSG